MVIRRHTNKILIAKKMNKIFIVALLACGILYSDVTINDSVDHSEFFDLSGIGEEPIALVLEAIADDTVSLRFESEQGKEYTITFSPDLAPGSWNIDGTTALFNGIEITSEGLDRYFYKATSTQTLVEITFTNGAPRKAFFKGAKFVSF
mgnify:CR=1 FL=1